MAIIKFAFTTLLLVGLLLGGLYDEDPPNYCDTNSPDPSRCIGFLDALEMKLREVGRSGVVSGNG